MDRMSTCTVLFWPWRYPWRLFHLADLFSVLRRILSRLVNVFNDLNILPAICQAFRTYVFGFSKSVAYLIDIS